MTHSETIIGGPLPLELHTGEAYHTGTLQLNSARYALEYVLRIKPCSKIYIPAYICDSVLQPIRRLGINYAFYRIDEHFRPLLNFKSEADAALLVVNYFGLHDVCIRNIRAHSFRVIVDNTQAFFAHPQPETDTIYSPRKFFGVPDGGYLYTDSDKRISLERECSSYRCDALLTAIDSGKAAAVSLFSENEADLDRCGMRAMSLLTQALLRGIDYERVRAQRNANFKQLDAALSSFNELRWQTDSLRGPLCYPLLIKEGHRLKTDLLARQIYTDDFWDDVLTRVSPGSFEARLAEDLVALPVDQHCEEADIERVIQAVKACICP
ncbi:MAG: hypothetical protein ABF868_11235 [Sporolactobacillus sp.]